MNKIEEVINLLDSLEVNSMNVSDVNMTDEIRLGFVLGGCCSRHVADGHAVILNAANQDVWKACWEPWA